MPLASAACDDEPRKIPGTYELVSAAGEPVPFREVDLGTYILWRDSLFVRFRGDSTGIDRGTFHMIAFGHQRSDGQVTELDPLHIHGIWGRVGEDRIEMWTSDERFITRATRTEAGIRADSLRTPAIGGRHAIPDWRFETRRPHPLLE